MWLFDKRKLQNIEYILIIIVGAIALFGLLAILMATASPDNGGEEADFFQIISRLDFKTVIKQVLWIVIGFAAMACVAMLDYHIYAKIWYIVTLVCIALIVFTSFFGEVHGGTRGWIAIGKNFTFQPTEIGKLALILMLALTCSKKERFATFKDLLPSFAVMAVFVCALLTQMDVGTSLVYVFIFIVMMFSAGMEWKHIGIVAAVGAVCLVALWFALGDQQKSRIINFINGEEVDQLKYAKIAIGSGGFFGKGFLGKNTISQSGVIPVIESDFIFASIGESLGFLGGTVLIILYAAMEMRMWKLTHVAFDKYGRMIIVGIMAMFMFHIFENIGMVTGIMPITGIPLPFVSYGGSSMLTNMIAIGLIESVCMNRPIKPFTEK